MGGTLNNTSGALRQRALSVVVETRALNAFQKIDRFDGSRDETTARANTSTMHSCMARAIQGTVGCRYGNGSPNDAINCLECTPFVQSFRFIFQMVRMGRKLDKPLIT